MGLLSKSSYRFKAKFLQETASWGFENSVRDLKGPLQGQQAVRYMQGRDCETVLSLSIPRKMELWGVMLCINEIWYSYYIQTAGNINMTL